jgi:hypothetical protein
MSENLSIADQLRVMADELDRALTTTISPDLSVSEAIARLRQVLRRGELEIELTWRERSGDVEITYKVSDGASYKKIAEGGSLATLVREVCVKREAPDTLDRIDAIMPTKLEPQTAESEKCAS